MSVNPFQGVSFFNPGYLCYCNSSVNGLLASKIITTKVNPSHCASCSFLHAKKSDLSTDQSSLLLKELVAQRHEQFNSFDQQDASEFLSCLIKDCSFLYDLTLSEIITSNKCSKCLNVNDDSDSEERKKKHLTSKYYK